MNESRRRLLAGALLPLTPFSLRSKEPDIEIPERLPPVPEITIEEGLVTDLPGQYLHLCPRLWSEWCADLAVTRLRPSLFQDRYRWPGTGVVGVVDHQFVNIGPALALHAAHVLPDEHLQFNDDPDAQATFQNLAVTFMLDQVTSISLLLNAFLIPGMTTLVRRVNMLSPNADQVITGALTAKVTVPHTRPILSVSNNVAVTSYAQQVEGKWFAVINMPIAFRWKLHKDREGIVQ